MNRYPLWKNLLVLIAIVGGGLIALPNIYGDDPAVLVSREDQGEISEIGFATWTSTGMDSTARFPRNWVRSLVCAA